MAEICCENKDCLYCKQDGSCIYNGYVHISDVYYSGCEEYEDYENSDDYQHEYWAAIKDLKSGKIERTQHYGRLVVINGRNFFTNSNPNCDEKHTVLTDGETGAYIGDMCHLKEHYDRYLKSSEDYKKEYGYNNVLELPIKDDIIDLKSLHENK